MTDLGASAPRRVFYNSHATEATYDLIRAEVPPGFELVTLARDSLDERRELIADCQVAIVAATPLTREILEPAGNLALVHHQGVGYHDTVAWELLAERGIPLALTPSGTTVSVAEHAVALILAACRRIPFADAELRKGHWHVNSLRPCSFELAGKTIGYVGMGRIGRATAERLRAFDTRGLYHDPHVTLERSAARALGLEAASLDDLLARADVVTLHVPATRETRHLVDARALARMKPTAILVNTARGPLVDEGALAAALASGRIAAAGLDVFEEEPLAVTSPLVGLPNVVLTPHISAGTREALATKMRALFENVVRFFAGGDLENRVAWPGA